MEKNITTVRTSTPVHKELKIFVAENSLEMLKVVDDAIIEYLQGNGYVFKNKELTESKKA